ncbi:MAG: helix-turn-helix domain-containing protein [Tateyamaria sp.]|uniref:helix-turn-helix domain-containing protein n=1 Tax=Tateyamaria sp. TaxID=1929288 RepID=UPI00329230FF
MPSKSQLVLPPKHLASCIAGCIVRDTRAVDLSDEERLNYFPGTPLFTATVTLEGQIHLGDAIASVAELRARPAVAKRVFHAPKTMPHTSWNPGPLHALTIAFFPDAWQRLGGNLQGKPSARILPAIDELEKGELATAWPRFWDKMSEVWAQSKSTNGLTDWAGSHRIKDWAFHLFGQVSQTGAGRGLRSTQRRLLRWTGQNRKALTFFAKVEEVHRLSISDSKATAADLAAQAGFADQSHMGRALKRATGFAPAALNRKIATEEAFWCYRLLGDRF